MKHDPHSGDYGLGFFGHSLETGAYFVEHKTLGTLCYFCDWDAASKTLVPRDSYHRRVFVEPLALHMTLETGMFASVSFDMDKNQLKVTLDQTTVDASAPLFSKWRLCLEKTSTQRPGEKFTVTPSVMERGCFMIEVATASVLVNWE